MFTIYGITMGEVGIESAWLLSLRFVPKLNRFYIAGAHRQTWDTEPRDHITIIIFQYNFDKNNEKYGAKLKFIIAQFT